MINTYLDQSTLVAMDRLRHEAEFDRLRGIVAAGDPETKPPPKKPFWQRLEGLVPRFQRGSTNEPQAL